MAVPNLNRRGSSALEYLEQVSPSPDIVALSVQILSHRLAFLCPKNRLLSPDPFKLRNGKQTNRLDIHA